MRGGMARRHIMELIGTVSDLHVSMLRGVHVCMDPIYGYIQVYMGAGIWGNLPFGFMAVGAKRLDSMGHVGLLVRVCTWGHHRGYRCGCSCMTP